ncbi:MAG: ferrous iron transport protein B [Bacteroidota bacterium]
MAAELKIALAGNPNSGKTSLFNALTGLNHKVSNFAGTTVEKKTGTFTISDNLKGILIDLPGTYSLYPKSADELVAHDLLGGEHGVDVVLFIADASNLKRNLLLLTQVADLGLPVILLLNMVDVAGRRGIFYDVKVLSEQLAIPVIEINARNKKGTDQIRQVLLAKAQWRITSYFTVSPGDKILADTIKGVSQKRTAYAALQSAINTVTFKGAGFAEINSMFTAHAFNSNAFQQHEILERYKVIDRATRAARSEKLTANNLQLTKKADRILTHRIWGLFIFLSVMFLVFQAIFSWSKYPMDWVEHAFAWLAHGTEVLLPAGILNDLVVHGIIAGLSGVMVFLPQIIILFAFIAFLEDVGYMARVGFIMDKVMRPFGMNGKSIVPLIGGMACAVPSIMATRSIESKKERLLTILVTPLMSCSARLPVYTLLIGLLVPDDAMLGPFNYHGILLMVMYLLGFAAALFSAALFKFFVKAREASYFIMELPGYKVPVLKNMFITLYQKGSAFVWGAGKIIVAVSVILWALASFGPGDEMQQIEARYAVAGQQSNEHLSAKKNAEKLEASYAGHFGKMIEPVIKPLGYDWKIGIALLTSLAAREVFVGTMSTIYSVGGSDDAAGIDAIREKMTTEKDAGGKPVYSAATIISLMVFYAFAMQCMSTLSVVRTETKTWKWPLIQFFYMTGLAYLAAWGVYNLLV